MEERDVRDWMTNQWSPWLESEFDEWLRSVKEEVYDEGWDDGHCGCSRWTGNPYAKEKM